jgi:hypothetical protein
MLGLARSSAAPLVLAVALVSSGCATATTDLMIPVAVPRAIRARPDAATVVFMRPSSRQSGSMTPILDGRGRFLGMSLAESYFATYVAPGPNVFIAWSLNPPAIRANLAPGKIYYVEVVVASGMGLQADLLAVTPSSESWSKRREWLTDSTQLEVDEAKGQALVAEHRANVVKLIQQAGERLRKYSPEDMAEHMLDPNDGI